MSAQRFEDIAYANGFSVEKQGDMYTNPYTAAAHKIYLQAQKDELDIRISQEQFLIEQQKEINQTLITAEARLREMNDLNARLVNIVKQMAKTIGDLV